MICAGPHATCGRASGGLARTRTRSWPAVRGGLRGAVPAGHDREEYPGHHHHRERDRSHQQEAGSSPSSLAASSPSFSLLRRVVAPRRPFVPLRLRVPTRAIGAEARLGLNRAAPRYARYSHRCLDIRAPLGAPLGTSLRASVDLVVLGSAAGARHGVVEVALARRAVVHTLSFPCRPRPPYGRARASFSPPPQEEARRNDHGR